MKKGQVSVKVIEELISIVLHTFFQILPVIVILLALYAIFSGSSAEPQVYDFNRVVAEAGALANENFDSIEVPVVAAKDFYLYSFPKQSESSKDLCQGKACLCMWQEVDNIRHCQQFEKVDFTQKVLPVTSAVKKISITKEKNVLSIA